MRLSKQSEYGLRALIRLASCWPRGQMRMHELAEMEGLPVYFLSNIMTRLRKNKFLRSSAGANGGFRLARAPERILISEMVACLESGLAFEEGRRDRRGSPGKAIVQRVDWLLTRKINAALKGLTLADLIEQVSNARREDDVLMYHI